MAAEAEVIGWDMAEPPLLPLKENKIAKGTFAVVGIMSTLVIYGILQVCCIMIFTVCVCLINTSVISTSTRTSMPYTSCFDR